MRKLYIYAISLLVLALITMAYTAPANNNVDLTLPTGYTAPANNNVDLVLDEALVPPPTSPVNGTIVASPSTIILNQYEDDDQ